MLTLSPVPSRRRGLVGKKNNKGIMTYTITTGQAFAQVEAETLDQAVEIGEEKIKEILKPHVAPDEDAYPCEFCVQSPDGLDHVYSLE